MAGMNEDALSVIKEVLTLIREGDERAELLIRASELSVSFDEKIAFLNDALPVAENNKIKIQLN